MSLKKLKSIGDDLFKWELAIRVNGRRVHRKFDDTEQGAHAIYVDLLHQKNRANLNLPSNPATENVTLEHAASEWLKHIVQLGLSESYSRNSGNALTLLLEVAGPVRLGHVTRETLLRWQTARARKTFGLQKKFPKARTVNKDFDSLSSFLTYCVEQRGWILQNPAHRIPRLKETPPPIRFQEWEHFEKLTEKAWEKRPALALLLEVIGESGCRVMEAARAKVSSIDVVRKQWTKIVKGNREVVVPAGPWAIAAATGRNAALPLCPRENGTPWLYNAIERMIPLMCAKAGVPLITAHCLRHGRAVWDLEADVPIYSVRLKLGHTTVKTTERYLRMATRRGQPERFRHTNSTRIESVCGLVSTPPVLCGSARLEAVPEQKPGRVKLPMKKGQNKATKGDAK